MGRFTLTFVSVFTLLILFPVQGNPAPTVELRTETRGFSPNDDGIQDNIRIFIRTRPDENLPLASYSVSITGPGGAKKTFLADRRKVRADRKVTNLYLPGKFTVSDLTAPRYIVWDGYDDAGRKVPDGSYTISFQGRTKDSRFLSATMRISVSTREPRARVSVSSPVLRIQTDADGNRTGAIGDIRISQSASGGSGFTYTGKIVNREGEVIEIRRYNTSLTSTVTWNGKNRGGELVPDGNYSYELAVMDESGNTAKAAVHNIVVTRLKGSAYLGPSERVYSPKSDDPDKKKIQFSRHGSVSASEFAIVNSSGEIVHKRPLYGSVPRRITYDGQGIESGGLYSAVLLSGGRTVSIPGTFYADLTEPDYSISASSGRFTPDGDGEDDYLILNFNYSDFSDVSRFHASFEIVLPDGTTVPIRSFSGSVLPDRFIWDGSGFKDVQLESLEEIRIVLSCRDGAGNTGPVYTLPVQTGVLFRPLTPGDQDLVARLPERKYFDEEEQELTGEGEDMIDSVLDKLNRYRRYYVYVESHSKVEGREEENLLRTEEIAYRFFEEFSDSYWPLNRMSYQGLGETELLFEEDTPFANYRNDRIEIRLVYDDRYQE